MQFISPDSLSGIFVRTFGNNDNNCLAAPNLHSLNRPLGTNNHWKKGLLYSVNKIFKPGLTGPNG